MGLLLFTTLLWRIPLLNHIVVLSILSVTIPPVSFDYTLLSLYAAFAMLCMLAIRANTLRHVVKSLNTTVGVICYRPHS